MPSEASWPQQPNTEPRLTAVLSTSLGQALALIHDFKSSSSTELASQTRSSLNFLPGFQ